MSDRSDRRVIRGILVLWIFVAVVTVFLTACGSSSGESSNVPKNFVGEWYQYSNEGETLAEATITSDSIQVNIVGRERGYIYWTGSFDANKSTHDEFKYVSRGDTEAMSGMLLASRDHFLRFTYKNGDLSFPYKSQGAVATVHLIKYEPTEVVPTVTVTQHYGIHIPSTKHTKTANPVRTPPRKAANPPPKAITTPKAPTPAPRPPVKVTK